MRISSDPTDPGYDPVRGRDVRIFLDGVPQKGVVTADEERGLIEAAVFDADGGLVLQGGSYVTETKRGDVRIVIESVRFNGG